MANHEEKKGWSKENFLLIQFLISEKTKASLNMLFTRSEWHAYILSIHWERHEIIVTDIELL